MPAKRADRRARDGGNERCMRMTVVAPAITLDPDWNGGYDRKSRGGYVPSEAPCLSPEGMKGVVVDQGYKLLYSDPTLSLSTRV